MIMIMRIEGAGIESLAAARAEAGTSGGVAGGGVAGTALIRLLTWMSPAFPIGAFSYSHGLETAIADGRCCDKDSVLGWLAALLEHGGGWSDAVLLGASWRAGNDLEVLLEINDLALSLAPSSERHMETTQQGAAFLAASRAWPLALHGTLHGAMDARGVQNWALPVIIGAVARGHGIGLDAILPAHLHAFASNLISVAMRLVPLGQSDGLWLQARLEPVILSVAAQAMEAGLDCVGGCCLHSDIAAMRHETLGTRIFRS